MEAGMDRRAVGLTDIVPLSPVRPIEAAIGMNPRSVHVRSISGPVEPANHQFAALGEAVDVGVG
jgi:hypothetical protein